MKIDYKFNEEKLLTEFKEYVDATYDAHYSKEKLIGNVMKYAQRYGKKGSDADARKDLLKVLHYALMQLHVHDTKSLR